MCTCPTDTGLPDGDDDGVCDTRDDCPTDPDTTQADSDSDGMPDEWETAHALNPNDASDASQLARDGGGYTNLENYINSL